MRRQLPRRAGQGALLALLLQLVLPLLALEQVSSAAPGPGGPFVICTGKGPVWIDPAASADDSDAPDGEPDPTHHCPICLGKQLAAAALLPGTPLHHPRPRQKTTSVPSIADLQPNAGRAPPLPPRGPPLAA